ncbi:MAG: T9SS type A sorting domain-containing protein [Ignavibacteria bacterium]|nr:T9SS type A sorting domain-containing protein [Ignavibacteria bacterium]
MKKILLTVLILVLGFSYAYSQPQPKIINQPVTPHMVTSDPVFATDSSVATGLNVVGNGVYVYLSVVNRTDTSAIQNTTWTFNMKPSGSTATFITIPSLGWVKFRTDVKGLYEVKCAITTSTGSADTTLKIFASDYVGVGNFQGVPAVFPNCMTCHAGMSKFLNIFNRWKESGHANIFKFEIDSGSSYYSTSCMKCHTTGYDHNLWNNNHGFDDVARTLGWNWANFSPPHPGVWDSLKLVYPSLVAFATIGCENCHGAGSEHTMGGDTSKIQISYDAGVCASCHDEPWRHNKYSEWENSGHSEMPWSNSFAQGPSNSSYMTNSLGNCIRCHDGKGFVNLTYERGTDTENMKEADLTMNSCQSCHDPHGDTPTGYHLRTVPADTLANGVSYSNLDEGKVCATCHMARRDVGAYTQTVVNSSHWGPHHSTQTDVIMGTNAGTFNSVPYLSGSHKTAVDGGCIGCHMAETTDTGTVTRDKVGGHTWNLHYESTNYDHVTGCLTCHPGITKFDDFIAPSDFDGNGLIEPWTVEFEGCATKLRTALPPTGLDSINYALIRADTFNVNLRKAYWNYQLIYYGSGKGMHNPFFSINVLLASVPNAIGVTPNGTEIPERFEMSQNYPNPFNPSTKIDFSVPRNSIVTMKIYDITGREVRSLVNQKLSPGKYTVDWNGTDNNGLQIATGVYFYRFVASGNVIVKKMVLIK